MAKNLLIESRDPFDSSDSEYFYELRVRLEKISFGNTTR